MSIFAFILSLYMQHFIVLTLISIVLICLLSWYCCKQFISLVSLKQSYKATVLAILHLANMQKESKDWDKQERAS